MKIDDERPKGMSRGSCNKKTLHVAVTVKNYLERLKWDFLHPPPYFADIATFNY